MCFSLHSFAVENKLQIHLFPSSNMNNVEEFSFLSLLCSFAFVFVIFRSSPIYGNITRRRWASKNKSRDKSRTEKLSDRGINNEPLKHWSRLSICSFSFFWVSTLPGENVIDFSFQSSCCGFFKESYEPCEELRWILVELRLCAVIDCS